MTQNILMLNGGAFIDIGIPDYLHPGQKIVACNYDSDNDYSRIDTIRSYKIDDTFGPTADVNIITALDDQTSIGSVFVVPSYIDDSSMHVVRFADASAQITAYASGNGKYWFVFGSTYFVNDSKPYIFISQPFDHTIINQNNIKVAWFQNFINGKPIGFTEGTYGNGSINVATYENMSTDSDKTDYNYSGGVSFNSLDDYPEAYKHLFETGDN